MISCLQCAVEVMQLWSDDDETEQVFPGENVKLKLKNVEEEVRIFSICLAFLFWTVYLFN